MTKNSSKTRASVALSLAYLLLICPPLWAEYNRELLAEAAGEYISAYNLANTLAESQCGYTIRNSRPTQSVVEEVVTYFKAEDKKDIEDLLASAQFRESLRESEKLIDGAYGSGVNGGFDKNTACGYTLGMVTCLITKAESNWKSVVSKHAK